MLLAQPCLAQIPVDGSQIFTHKLGVPLLFPKPATPNKSQTSSFSPYVVR
jgi:hypothetical protein